MLIALFALFFLGGGDAALLGRVEMLLDNVKAEVQSEERRAQAVDILKNLKDVTKDFEERQGDRAKEFGELNESRALDTAGADAVWSAMMDDIEAYHAQMLSVRQDLKTVIQRDEWGSVLAVEPLD